MGTVRFIVNPLFEPELLRSPFGVGLIAEATAAVEAAAKRIVPIRLGFLRDSIHSASGIGATGTLVGRVVATDFKAHWYEFGSRRTPAIHYLAGGLAAALPGVPITGGGGRGMSSPGELVDVERLIVEHLLADAAVIAAAGGTGANIGQRLRADYVAAKPALTITRLPGIHVDRETGRLERCRLDGQAWAAPRNEAAAFDLANAAVVSLFAMVDGPHTLGVVTNVELEQSPWLNADPESDLARYIFGFAVWVHPI